MKQHFITHKNIIFLDAQNMRLTYLSTFAAPNMEDLESLKKGDFVKVSVNSERFWCYVEEINGFFIKGRIDNHLALNTKIGFNDIIEIPQNCILDILDH